MVTFEVQVLLSVVYFVIYKAKKKLFTKQKLLEVHSWILVIFVPTTALIPVLFSIFPQNPHIILVPYWIGLGLWLLMGSITELNKDEKPLRLQMLLRMGLLLFSIGIVVHLALFVATSLNVKFG